MDQKVRYLESLAHNIMEIKIYYSIFVRGTDDGPFGSPRDPRNIHHSMPQWVPLTFTKDLEFAAINNWITTV